MTEIPDFPEELLHLHHAWHNHAAHPDLPGRVIPFGQPGSGLEFLIFHRDFMHKFHDWYDTQPFADAAAVAAWAAIPAEMKVPEADWTDVLAAQEQRIVTGVPPYADADALGQDIEGGIHNQWLHSAAATIYHDELVRSPSTSPLSTLFYKIHGLINYWWSVRFPISFSMKSTPSKDEADSHVHIGHHVPMKTNIKDEVDVPIKHLMPELKDVPEGPKFKEFKEFKEKDKDIAEGGFPGGDVVRAPLGPLVSEVSHRMRLLEGQLGQAFIRPSERPDVGASHERGENQDEEGNG